MSTFRWLLRAWLCFWAWLRGTSVPYEPLAQYITRSYHPYFPRRNPRAPGRKHKQNRLATSRKAKAKHRRRA